jgi:hypothetical protein
MVAVVAVVAMVVVISKHRFVNTLQRLPTANCLLMGFS